MQEGHTNVGEVIGVIVNITGSLEAEKANVIYENNIGNLVSGSFLNPFKINLNQSIARIEYGKGAYNSTSKILARTALSGLSASAWKSGSGGWAGIFAGLASSVDLAEAILRKLTGMSVSDYEAWKRKEGEE